MLRDDTSETVPADDSSPALGMRPREGAPLDPAIERIRARLQRLMLMGIGTLLLGVVAVAIVAFYRANGQPSTPGAGGDVTLPTVPGAVLENASLAQNGLLLRFLMPDGTTQLVVLDPATGSPRLRVSLVDGTAAN